MVNVRPLAGDSQAPFVAIFFSLPLFLPAALVQYVTPVATNVYEKAQNGLGRKCDP